jgi:protein-disulfide isomerase
MRESTQSFRWIGIKNFLEIVATVIVIVLAAVMLYRLMRTPPPIGTDVVTGGNTRGTPPPPPPPVPPIPLQPISLDGAAVRGSRTAKVGILEYWDAQCPYCKRFVDETLPVIERDYISSGRLLLALRPFPLESIHPFAFRAAESAECARRQNQFWPMYETLLKEPSRLNDAVVSQRAKDMPLDLARFMSCLEREAATKVVKDTATGRAIGVTGTPAFFIGSIETDGRLKVTTRLPGAVPAERFKAAIEAVLTETAAK